MEVALDVYADFVILHNKYYTNVLFVFKFYNYSTLTFNLCWLFMYKRSFQSCLSNLAVFLHEVHPLAAHFLSSVTHVRPPQQILLGLPQKEN